MVTKEELLLEEWKACEETIRNFDRILINIRFYGVTVTLAFMGAAFESLRSPRATISLCGRIFHIATFIESLSVVSALIFYIFHRHYFQFLKLTVDRQRQIERQLLVNDKPVLRLGQEITRKRMPRFFRDPWNLLFAFLVIIGAFLTAMLMLTPIAN